VSLKGAQAVATRVFISYSHQDAEFTRILSTALGEIGVECFLDEKDIDRKAARRSGLPRLSFLPVLEVRINRGLCGCCRRLRRGILGRFRW
jgi:hypothetical protein